MATAPAYNRRTPAAIPPPPNFPITWERPGDERLFWTRDRLHVAEPITPMTAAFLRYVFEDGFNAAAQSYELPVRARTGCFNAYFYSAMVPVGAPPAAVLRAIAWLRRKSPGLVDRLLGLVLGPQNRRSQATLEAAMARLGEAWNQEILPEIKQHLAYWEQFDLRGASMPALLAHLEETIARTRRVWELHFRLMLPAQLARSMFDELYRDLFGDAGAFEPYRLLQGFDNKTVACDRALWDLSRAAQASTQVRQALDLGGVDAVLAALEQSPAGKSFLAELRTYLGAYGQRGDRLFELSLPSWAEDPSPVVEILKEYIAQPDRDIAAERVVLAAERDRLRAAARGRLKGYPRRIAERFAFLLEAAQTAAVIGEDHHFWIDLRTSYELRRVLLEFGRRLAEAGALEQPADVFYLTFDELRKTAKALPRIDRRQLVAGRQAELAYFRTIAPPSALGRPPLMPPPDMPLVRAIGKFLGGQPQSPTAPNALQGHAGSPGVVRGPARVLRSLAEAGKLQQGDVLVAATTAPPWTPLFATVAAVVTDAGGVLSHGAVVAREYGIPAVVGAGVATAAIRDGQLLEVNGDTGVVYLIASD